MSTAYSHPEGTPMEPAGPWPEPGAEGLRAPAPMATEGASPVALAEPAAHVVLVDPADHVLPPEPQGLPPLPPRPGRPGRVDAAARGRQAWARQAPTRPEEAPADRGWAAPPAPPAARPANHTGHGEVRVAPADPQRYAGGGPVAGTHHGEVRAPRTPVGPFNAPAPAPVQSVNGWPANPANPAGPVTPGDPGNPANPAGPVHSVNGWLANPAAPAPAAPAAPVSGEYGPEARAPRTPVGPFNVAAPAGPAQPVNGWPAPPANPPTVARPVDPLDVATAYREETRAPEAPVGPLNGARSVGRMEPGRRMAQVDRMAHAAPAQPVERPVQAVANGHVPAGSAEPVEVPDREASADPRGPVGHGGAVTHADAGVTMPSVEGANPVESGERAWAAAPSARMTHVGPGHSADHGRPAEPVERPVQAVANGHVVPAGPSEPVETQDRSALAYPAGPVGGPGFGDLVGHAAQPEPADLAGWTVPAGSVGPVDRPDPVAPAHPVNGAARSMDVVEPAHDAGPASAASPAPMGDTAYAEGHAQFLRPAQPGDPAQAQAVTPVQAQGLGHVVDAAHGTGPVDEWGPRDAAGPVDGDRDAHPVDGVNRDHPVAPLNHGKVADEAAGVVVGSAADQFRDADDARAAGQLPGTVIKNDAGTEIPVHMPFRDVSQNGTAPRRAGRPAPPVNPDLVEHPGPALPGWAALLAGTVSLVGCAGALLRAGFLPDSVARATGLPSYPYSGLGLGHWAVLAVCGLLALLALGGLGRGRVGHAWVLTLFGQYRGSVRRTGLVWMSPLLMHRRVDVRLRHWRSEPMPVVDANGVALRVVVLVVWQIKNTVRAALAVADHEAYLRDQVEAAMARVLSQLPADAFHDEAPTLRDAEAVGDELTRMLSAEAEPVGIEVFSAQPTRIEYAPEVAAAMQRSRVEALDAKHRDSVLTAVVDAVDDTVNRLTARGLVDLDDYERKALVKDLTVAFYTGRVG